MKVNAALFLLTLFGANLAVSQSLQPQPGASRQEFESMMEAYIISKLQDSLSLTDEQYAGMVVAQKKLQETQRNYRRQRSEFLRQLRRIGRVDGADNELAGVLAGFDQLKREFQESEWTRYAAIDEILNVQQRARYRILEVEIQRRLQELVRRMSRPDRPRKR